MLLPFLLCVLILYIPPPMGQMSAPLLLNAAGVVLLALLNAAAAWVGSGLAIRLCRLPGPGGPVAANRVFSFLKGGVVGFVLADVFALGWPSLVEGLLGDHVWAVLVYDLVLLLPAVAMILTVMACQHRFESRRARVSLPLARYLWLRFRVEIAIILVPWLALVLITGVVAILFRQSASARLADSVASGAVLLLIVAFSPLLLRIMWATSPMPAGALRERLEAFCRSHRFRCDDILIWHTHNHLANAGVVGPTPFLRYVMLTDVLLERCTDEEIEAIFAHEVGHVRHRHLPFYLLFGVAFVCFYANLMDLLALTGWVRRLENIFAFSLTVRQASVMLAFAGAYWMLAFGFISRRMELQADLFGLRAVRNPISLLSALGKLAAMSSTPRRIASWRHFSIEERLHFLHGVLSDPPKAARFRLKIAAIQLAVVGLLALGTARLLLLRPELFGI